MSIKKMFKKTVITFTTILSCILFLFACGSNATTTSEVNNEPNDKDIVVLFTNDVHCGIEDNIGYAGLAYYYNGIKKQDVYATLVDGGDFSQGAPIGTLSKGKHLASIMNKIGYEFVVPGNHEFDYEMHGFKNIVAELNNVIFSSNVMDLNANTPLLHPYKIFTFGNKKVAFVGVTSPMTLTTSTPVYFQDGNGKYIYGFCEDETGDALVNNIQANVDAAKKEGVNYVILVGHLGIEGTPTRWTSETLLNKTNGIDFCIDAHSHETYIKDITNKDGKNVKLAQTGTKLSNIGKLTISKDGEFTCEMIDKVLPFDGDTPALNEKGHAIDDEVNAFIQGIKSEYEEMLNEVIYKENQVDLIVKDPATGDRIVRTAETNFGDLCADAYRIIMGADIGVMNGGGIRAELSKGDITYNDCLSVMPFSNLACVVRVSGQTILDALEWGAHKYPEENGGFLQVSGMTYTIDSKIPTPCKQDEKENYAGIEGERRVKDVKVNNESIDPNKYYTLACHNYKLKNGGDGYIMFKGSELIKDCTMVDNEVLVEYIKKYGTEKYNNPYGEGRINILK